MTQIRHLFLLILVLPGFAVPAPAHDRSSLFSVGMMWASWLPASDLPAPYQANPRAYDQAQMALIRNLGCSTTTGTFDWISVEPTRGVYDWTAADQRTADARAAGLDIIAYIGNTPDWALPPNGLPGWRTPPDEAYRAEFEAYCTAVAARYAGQVDRFFFWNEPNGCSWVKDGCQNMDGYPLYTRWLKRAYAALKVGNPNCKVGAGVLDYQQGLESWRFLDGMYREGARDSFDAVVIHPYNFGGGVNWAGILETRQVMLNFLDGHKDIWINEYGWPNSADSRAREWLRDFLLRIKQPDYEYVTLCRYLVLTDLENGQFGLCNRQLTPRPIYDEFRTLDKSLPPTYTPTPTHAVRFATPPPAGTNVVYNGDASLGMAGWQLRQSTHPNIPPIAMTTATGTFRISTQYLEVAAFQYQTVDVRPWGQYEMSFRAIQTDGTDQDIQMYWYDGEVTPGFNPVLQDGYGALEGLHTQGVYTMVGRLGYDQAYPAWTMRTSQRFQPTGTRATIALYYRHAHPSNTCLWEVDDIVVREVPGTTPIPTVTPGGSGVGNLLANPGGEAGTLTGWGVGGETPPILDAPYDLPSPVSRSGSHRFSWTSTSTAQGFLYQTVPVIAGRRYKIGLYAVQKDGTDEYLDVYFANGDVNAGWNWLLGLGSAAKPTWTEFEGTVNAISDRLTVGLLFRHTWPTNRATFHVDDVYVVDVSEPGPTLTPTLTPTPRSRPVVEVR